MNEITVSAKTLDDAITEASIQLGVTSDHMEYDVIEKGSSGFLGFGIKQAVIKARIKKEKEEIVEPKVEAVKKEEKPYVKKENKKDFHKENKKDFKKDSKKENRKEGKKDFKKEVKAEPKQSPKHEPKQAEPVSAPKEEIKVTVATEETCKICEDFLRNVLRAMGMGEVELITKIDEDGALSIEMKGENMGILIGKRGQTLDSLQYLTNRVANKSQDGYVRVKLDTEDYRRRRKQTLENLAKNIAYKVKRSRKPVSLEPMNPYERRIIHSALQGDEKVSTHSEGEEPYRRVVVTPNRR